MQENRKRGFGEYLGREGVYFPHRTQIEQTIVSFSEPIVSLSRRNIRGEQNANLYKPHPANEGTLEEAQEFNLSDFAKITTGEEYFSVTATVRREAAASMLADSTPTKKMKAALVSRLDAEVLTNQRLYHRANIESDGLMCPECTDLFAIETEEHLH